MKSLFYNSYDGSIKLSAEECKISNTFFYNSLTCHRYLLKDIEEEKEDIKHIFKTLLESNSTYFVIGTDTGNMNSTVVFDKVELVKVLKKYDFEYGISYIDYYDYVLSLDIVFKESVPEFSNSKNIDLFLSYSDLSEIIKGINMDETMQSNCEKIKHWWSQKELFKEMD